MALSLRIMLIICAILILVFVISKIKKTQMQALDSIFWLFFCLSFVVFGLFPELPTAISDFFGFISPANFVFLYVISILVVRDFTNSIRIAHQNRRIDNLAQAIALKDIDR